MSEYFKNINKIQYEGPKSKNPLAFKHYNPTEVIEGKTMQEHLRFSVVYWHTMRGSGSDPFGVGTMVRPWEDGTDSLDNAVRRANVMFEITSKLQAPYYAFHDRDVALCASPLHARRCHHLQLRCVCLCCRSGEESVGSNQRTRW